MAAPNIQTSSNPQTVTGGEMGAVIGYAPDTKVGFYGEVGNVQQTVAAAGSDAGTTQTLANSLRTILIDLGLVKA
jgi:hypothetical protein